MQLGGREIERAEKECLGKCCLLNLALRSKEGQRNESPGWPRVVKRGFLEGRVWRGRDCWGQMMR